MKRDRAQTNIRIDEIPAELCTRKEAAAILGVHPSSFTNRDRYKSLPFAYVVYKGHSLTLYNRKMIEALKYKPCPDGYISAIESAAILGFIHKNPPNAVSTVRACMEKYGFQPKLVKAHHSYLVWKREDVERVKKMKTTSVPNGYISTREASELLNMRRSYGTIYYLRKFGLEPIKGAASHSPCYWKREDVEKVRKMREKGETYGNVDDN